ncbi:MAG: hypothetical protein QM644_21115 [Mobilitalea sp.]
MKKISLVALVLLLIFGMVGCTKDDLNIDVNEISQNTFLAMKSGELKVATVEIFDKDYYQKDELEAFVKTETEEYNKKNENDKITIDQIEVSQSKAVMLLTYNGMRAYSTFNEVPSAYFNGGLKDVALELPTTLISAKNEDLASTEEVLLNEDYKILILYEPYEIVVEGKVKYYSNGATLLKDNRVQAAADGITIVVFK